MKCLRCGEENKKRLAALREWNILTWRETEFFVCKDRLACRARQLRARPARMKVNERDHPLPGSMMETEWL